MFTISQQVKYPTFDHLLVFGDLWSLRVRRHMLVKGKKLLRQPTEIIIPNNVMWTVNMKLTPITGDTYRVFYSSMTIVTDS